MFFPLRVGCRRLANTPGLRKPMFSPRFVSSGTEGVVEDLKTEISEEISLLEEKLSMMYEKQKSLKERLKLVGEDNKQAEVRHRQNLDNSRLYSITPAARSLLDVADNLDRAVSAISEEDRKACPTVKKVFESVKNTEKNLMSTLHTFGIKKSNPMGEVFDPNVHEAMFQIPLPGKEDGEIISVMNTGFKIHERVLRAARVGVAVNPQ